MRIIMQVSSSGNLPAPPTGWWSMAFTGNGMLGAMVTAGNQTAADLGTLRAHSERQLTAHGASIEANKSKLLQCAQAIEKQWSTTKVRDNLLLGRFSLAVEGLTVTLSHAHAHCAAYAGPPAAARVDPLQLRAAQPAVAGTEFN